MLKTTFTLAAILTMAAFGEPTKAPEKKDAPAKKEAKEEKAKKEAKEDEAKAEPKKGKKTEADKAKAAIEELTLRNNFAEAKSKHDTNGLRSELAALELEKKILTEKLAIATLKESTKAADVIAKFNAEKEKLTREATLAKLEADKLASEVKALQAASSLKTNALQAQIAEIEAKEKREDYANATPKYLENPLLKDGTLVVSDRRIPFNGPVTSRLADEVTTRINYFNNKDPKKPIFIVIDDSPGGSVMAGYRILKAMEGSEAPVYVVVKSFAASMAACITTLAEKSFAYPNAVILHHQISQTFMFSSLNLTDQKENYEEMKKWWARLADPIAQKMGITSDEFIEMMYEKTKSGDWTEFGDDAKKLKWVDNIVERIHETALVKNPDAKKPTTTVTRTSDAGTGTLRPDGLVSAIDDKGTPYLILPRRNPKDVYFMYNPDGYYRFK